MSITIIVPTPKLSPRAQRWALLPLLALALTFVWGHDGAGPVSATAPPAANDAFGSAKVAGALPYEDAVNTSSATFATNDPPITCKGSYDHSVWYSYTPSFGQTTVEVSTGGSDYDTVLAAFTGSKGSLSQVGCNDDANTNSAQSYLKVTLTAGTKYYFMVGSWTTSPGGKLRFHLNFQPTVGLSAHVLQGGGCDTLTKDFKCLVAPGSRFSVLASVDKLSGLPNPDGDLKTGYRGFRVMFHFSPGLTAKSEFADVGWLWPDCPALGRFTASAGPNVFGLGCDLGVGANESTYTGEMARVDFNCPPYKSKETITITHGNDFQDTRLIDESGTARSDNDVAAETLVINCDNFFPWDVDGNGIVTLFGDIFAVTQHFNETKP